MAKMKKDQLVQYIRARISDSETMYSELGNVRAELTERYFGQQYGNEEKDQSAYTSREIMEIIEWAKPALIRGFLGSANAVSFEPVSRER